MVAALFALGAAGCGSGGTGDTAADAPAASTPAATSPPAATTPAAPATPAPSATSAPSAGVPSTPPKGAAGVPASSARCTATGLKMRLGRGDPGAGNVYFPLQFTNTTGRSCVLTGFPGVSLIRGDGSVIGRPADRRGPTGKAVSIAAGQTVQADLHTLNKGIKGDSCWIEPTYLMVYPPGSTESLTLATSSPLVCGDTFDVSAVH